MGDKTDGPYASKTFACAVSESRMTGLDLQQLMLMCDVESALKGCVVGMDQHGLS